MELFYCCLEVMGEKQPKKLYRSKINSVLAGVCGGLGEYFDIDPVLIRALFVLVTLAGGSGLVLYLILWIIIPSEENKDADFEKNIKHNVEDIKSKAKTVASEFKIARKAEKKRDDSRFLLALFIIFLGVIFLLNNFGFYGFFDFGKIWPVFIILFGIIVLLRRD